VNTAEALRLVHELRDKGLVGLKNNDKYLDVEVFYPDIPEIVADKLEPFIFTDEVFS
jgi:hypothetical protein